MISLPYFMSFEHTFKGTYQSDQPPQWPAAIGVNQKSAIRPSPAVRIELGGKAAGCSPGATDLVHCPRRCARKATLGLLQKVSLGYVI
jgi:hypothetical protein